MIGDMEEIICKNNLAEAMGKMARNIEGVGSLEALKEKYPEGYKKLHDKIKELTGAYVEAALNGVEYSSSIPAEEILQMWAGTKPVINDAIKRNDADLVQKSVGDFIFNVFTKFRDKSRIRYNIPEEVA